MGNKLNKIEGIQGMKQVKGYKFTQDKLEDIIREQKKIIESQDKELKKLKCSVWRLGPRDELPETD